ncbi:RNA polymerase sigma factor [Burkholderia plantarii]|uniref:RNA polymerase sigma factor n=1 Tax=Burkholderia plantarii TaxID=41899 RepID=UPI0006D8AC6F|nr:RNA polymerase sigma factor [Burkholderia plantarii]ALK34549.1 ECF subfamily RNA polymerase sigma-24 subunit [Burkholderia plantarii]GLZ22680.1 RNA polymerase sigma factor [Burkholderia plantarii]
MFFKTDPDAALIGRIAQGDDKAAAALVTRKLHRIVALAYRMLGDAAEAEDVAQEVFVRVWKYARSWREERARVDTWLHRIALNVCHDRLELRSRRRETDALDPGLQADTGPTPVALWLAKSLRERVQDALATLPVRQREALVLTYYQELGNAEAATAMALSVEAVESLLARARKSLRQRLLDIQA